ncbi:lipase member M-like isoform X4 [Ahaetulla prasina]|uniref:lipase member M-like isoform X4 n=1 Tax=Ahaetulla prasina TaxID=499056 RepID=UPI0026478EF1|nr:lipase member M-like isoform X4 [Ahaetulla prasina]
MWLLFLVVFAIQGISSSTEIVLQARNPEAYMNISEIIHHKGYQAEEYEIATSDGYILTLNRIPHGRKQHWNLSGKPVVLLQHGLCLEGRVWIANMPNQSLGFMLADAGYDVWIGNNRGNSWSRKHQYFTIKQDQYHAYSFDEMARYDLPAMISFIVEKTRTSKIHLVGFSQGAAQGLIVLSSMPHVAEKIKMFHALSPATTLKNSQNPIIKLLFLPDAAIKSRMDVYMSYFPDSTSVQNILHWGQDEPPSYNVERITVPISIWYGENDLLVTPDNVKALINQLHSVVYKASLSDWNHFDFILGLDASKRVYSPLIKLISLHS